MGLVSRFWRVVGNTTSWFVNMLVSKEGLSSIAEADLRLSQGKSVLMYGNHPSSIATGYIHPVFVQMRSRDPAVSGAVVSYKFVDGRMGMSGKIVMAIFEQIGLTALPVVQFYDTMPVEKKKRINRESSEKTISFLKSGGVVLIFPEATRSAGGLIQAQPGLGRFAMYADYIMPIVSPYPIWNGLPFVTRERVGYLPLIETARLKPLMSAMGSKPFSELFGEYLMSWLAFNMPAAKRGYYSSFAQWFAKPVVGRYLMIHEALTKT